ncbi:TetR/AcrR family transcriptional regulator [Rhodococcus sp. NPDC060086]|uniref:TetR/AcrR family transcriptional regulator n=1 Tax=Rhodococcus sp. NPDC060086 TaxID=3347055 RepID=UPI00365AE462
MGDKMMTMSKNSSVSSPQPVSRKEQGEATRQLLLTTAEQLIAEQGMAQVSMRHIVEAAGIGNNSALKYHIGNRVDLVRAIIRRHGEPIAARTRELSEQVRDSDDPRDHVASFIRPHIEHLAELGNPSWQARFIAQVDVDPVLRDEILTGTLVQVPRYDTWSGVPELPPAEEALRSRALRMVVLHTCAAEERLAASTGVPADWPMIGEALIDAVTGMLTAPRHPRNAHSEPTANEGNSP